MGNKIDLIVKYATEAWDEVYKQESRSSLLDGNKKLMKFEGANTVKIAKFSASGLSDYKRANEAAGNDYGAGAFNSTAQSGYGYAQADMALTWETFTMGCDRAAQYRIDLFDNEETDALAIGMATKEVSRTVMIPEVDSYCFSKLATDYAGKSVDTEIVLAAEANKVQPIQALNNALQYFDEHEVPAEDQIIFASPSFVQKLRSTGELYKRLDQAEYKKNVSFLIEEYEGRPIVMVSPNRFKTDIVLGNGGYTFGANAHAIEFMVVAKSAVYHVVKYNKVRVFAPDVVQDYDGYKVNARIYHDVFVPDNKRLAVYVHIKNGNAEAGLAVGADLFVASTAGSAQNGTLLTIQNVIGNTAMVAKYAYKLATSAGTAPAAGTAVNGYTDITGVGLPLTTDEIAASSNTHATVVALGKDNKVIASKVIALNKKA